MSLTYTGLSPSVVRRSRRLLLPTLRLQMIHTPHLSKVSQGDSVCPIPFSFATTNGISFDFFSSPYWDASVRGVPFPHRGMTLMSGGPIQLFADPRDSCLSPRLIAACHDLLRLSSRAIPQSGCSILLISTFPLSIYYLNTGTHCESSGVQAYQFWHLRSLRLPAGRRNLNHLPWYLIVSKCTKSNSPTYLWYMN